MSDFASFLQRMETETNGYRKPQPEVEEPVYEEELDEEIEEEEESYDDEPIQEEDFGTDEEELDEEIIVERAFDYARIFMKTIRENFSDKSQRRIILETVRNAINMSLGSNQQSIEENYHQPVKQQRQQEANTNWPKADEAPIRLNDFSDQPAPQISTNYQTSESSGSGYKRDVKLGLKMGKNGQPEVDTSQMTNEDVADMRVLAGIEEIKE